MIQHVEGVVTKVVKKAKNYILVINGDGYGDWLPVKPAVEVGKTVSFDWEQNGDYRNVVGDIKEIVGVTKREEVTHEKPEFTSKLTDSKPVLEVGYREGRTEKMKACIEDAEKVVQEGRLKDLCNPEDISEHVRAIGISFYIQETRR